MKLFIFCLLIFLAENLISTNVNFEHIGVADGLSQTSVFSIYQDDLGYMWFGTQEGLNRYDGKNIKIILSGEDEKTGLTSNIINSIHGKLDKLYILCGYNQVVEYDTKKDKFRAISQQSQHIFAGKDNLMISSRNILQRMNYDTETISDYYKIDDRLEITCIFESNNNNIYLGTENGLCIIDKNKSRSQLIGGSYITSVIEDSKQNIWVGTSGDGVFKINRYGKIDKYSSKNKSNLTLSNNIIRAICEDDFGRIWIGTFSGLNCIFPETGYTVVYENKTNKSTELAHNSVFSLFKDSQGTIWIGTFYGGVNFHNPEFSVFTYFFSNDNGSGVSFPVVGRMTEDNDNNLWICTEGGGLNFFNRKNNTFKYYNVENSGLSHNNAKCIWYNKFNNKLYIGTHLGGLNIFDIKNNTFKVLRAIPRSYSLPDDIVNEIIPYKDKLVIFTHKGIVQMDLSSEKIEPFFENSEFEKLVKSVYTTSMFIDSKENVWICLTEGGVLRYDLKNKSFKRYIRTSSNIGRHAIYDIYETTSGSLLFSTLGSGLFEYIPSKDDFKRYSAEQNGLLSNFIYQITETKLGHILLLTNNGVNILNKDKVGLYILNSNTGFPLEKINSECGVCVMDDGEIFIGGNNGMTSFYESQLNHRPINYKLFFSELYVNNKLVSPAINNDVLSYSLPYVNSIRLKHNQTNLLIQFTTSNYIKLNPKTFEYKLIGIDETWIPTESQNIRYSNLKPGKYKLIVRDKADEIGKEITMDIRVLPPIYASTVAFLFYFLLLSLTIWVLLRLNRAKQELKTSLDLEISENNKIQELNQAKLQFFTNVSHEFRTPLTLIIGQIEFILQMEDLPQFIASRLQKVHKSATQLTSLISELLNFRKQEKELLELKVTELDIVEFAKIIFNLFKDLAEHKQIKYSFSSIENEILLWFDPLQLQKVIHNLLSNAFKYTNEKESISLEIKKNSGQVLIQIVDSGIGIADEDLTKIFERFYQGRNINTQYNKGTGIGLALSKGIVDLHHGTISVKNNSTKGSTFTVALQQGSDHFTPKEKQTRKSTDWSYLKNNGLPDETFFDEIRKENFGVSNITESSELKILIAEDDDEILNFLVDLFSPIYQVVTAKDGEEAFEKVQSIQPDIVLSDIMMPKMSGKELCHKIKSNFETSHIPVVLITADTSEEQNLEGLLVGADDYITKPFNVKLLISRCNNLVFTHKRMQEIYSKQIDSTPIAISTNKRDQELLKLATDVIGKFLDDADFNVNTFATEMALSRSKLYLKIKGLTGMTPNEFIVNTRLKKGASLLLTSSDLSVSDITYMVGFTSPRYFSKCFKNLFGLSPLNYRRANGVNTYEGMSCEDSDEERS